MDDHGNVDRLEDITTEEFYLFTIRRARQRDSLTVWLSDAYIFGDMDFFNRPQELQRGDFILVAKPEGGFQVHDELIADAHIGVGKIGKFMGALNHRNPWEYLTHEERERREGRR